MRKSLTRKHWLWVSGILGAFILNLTASFFNQMTGHAEILQSLQEIRESKRDLLAEMLRIQAGLASSFDTLVAIQQQEMWSAKKFKTHIQKNLHFNSLEIDQAYEKYLQQRDDQTDAVDTFKRTVAVMRNSLHYLPTVAANTMQAVSSEEEKMKVQILFQDILAYVALPEALGESKLFDQVEDLKREVKIEDISNETRNFLKHVENIVQGNLAIQTVLRKLSNKDWIVPLETLTAAYSKFREHSQLIQGRFQLISYTLFFILIAFVVSLVRKLHATFSLLKGQNEEIQMALGKAEAASAAKGIFLANMSHEIRTPLNGIRGSLHIIGKTIATPHQKQFLEIALQSCETLSVIINDVLDFSKIEAGRMELFEELVDIRQLIERTLKIQLARAEEKGILLESLVHQDVPERIKVDKTRFSQVLLNLIGNAVKFTAKGSVVLEVCLLSDDGKQCRIRFDVRDTGVGIPGKTIPLLFEAFTQADLSTTKKFGGTGLGLAICKQLISLMNGNIGIESKVGVGSTFWFEIEVTRSVLEQETNRYFSVIPNKIKILLIGLNKEYQEILSRQFASWGFGVDVVEKLEELETNLIDARVRASPYTLLLVTSEDIPGMAEYLEGHTWKENSDSLCVAVLCSTETSSYSRALEKGLIQRVSRPLQQSDLFDTLMNLLMHSRDEGLQQTAKSWQLPVPAADVYSNAQVLVAEDNEVNRIIARELFRELGIVPTIVENGKVALETFMRAPFSLVFLDCHMPEMDGFDAALEMRRYEKKHDLKAVPIVALTADVTVEAQQLCSAVGMTSYLSKPLDPQRLADELKKFLPIAVTRSSTKVAPVDGLNAPIDESSLRQKFNDNGDLIKMILNEFEKQIRKSVDIITAAVEQNDMTRLFQEAHALKGASSAAAAPQIRNIAEQLEQQGKLNNGQLEATKLLKPLVDASNLCLGYIQVLHSKNMS